MLKLWNAFWNGDDSGQGLAEYALILAFVAVALIGAVVFFGDRLKTLFESTANALPTSPGDTTAGI